MVDELIKQYNAEGQDVKKNMTHKELNDQFASIPLNDRQRLALVYLRNNGQIANSEYQRLNHVDSVTANRDLNAFVHSGLIKQHKSKRWAYYTLSVSPEAVKPEVPQTDEEKILDYVKRYGSIKNSECCQALGINSSQAWYLLKKLSSKGLLIPQGEKRWKRYILP
jgi:predicted HTH transcriptional regulator